MRTGLSFSHVSDCVSEALTFIYLDSERMEVARRYGLRGAHEIYSLMEDFRDGDSSEKANAEAVMTAFAADSKVAIQSACVVFLFSQIADDPHTEFLLQVWS